jgi:HSP20 family protein
MKTIVRKSMFPSLFDEFFSDNLLRQERFPIKKELVKFSSPAINVKETDGAYELELAAPGMKKEDFKIEIEKNLLTLSTEKREEKTEEKENYSRKEFGYYSFKRSFSLPEDKVNTEDIRAKYEDGVLHVAIPKIAKEAQKPIVKRIEIG